MSVEQREFGISQEVIEKIPAVFGFQEPRRVEFEGVVQAYRDAQSYHRGLLELHGARLREIEAPVEAAQKAREQLEESMLEAKRQIARGQNDYNPEKADVNFGRLGVRLNESSAKLSGLKRRVIPFLFRHLGGMQTEEHPFITQAQEELTQAQAAEVQARHNWQVQNAKINREMQPGIASSEQAIGRKENELLQYIGQSVSFSRSEMLELARLIPLRQEKIIDMYIGSQVADSELVHFPEFLVETEEFQWEKKLPRHKKLWHGPQPWVDITRNPETNQDEVSIRPPTKDEFEALPPRVKYLWRGFLRERFLEDLKG